MLGIHWDKAKNTALKVYYRLSHVECAEACYNSAMHELSSYGKPQPKPYNGYGKSAASAHVCNVYNGINVWHPTK